MLSLSPGASRVCLAGFSLRQADIAGLPPSESLQAGNVSLPLTPDACLERTAAVAADFVDFLYDVDRRYFQAMRDFLRQELHCQHPIKGTQVDQYSSYFSQSQADFLDAHGYWQHPSFPHKPWDPKDWTIGNSPMINKGCEMAVELAGCRVRGRPYNISEYCHPAPSTYCAEQVPTVAALRALQDWDGITFHCWNEWHYDWHRREVRQASAGSPRQLLQSRPASGQAGDVAVRVPRVPTGRRGPCPPRTGHRRDAGRREAMADGPAAIAANGGGRTAWPVWKGQAGSTLLPTD